MVQIGVKKEKTFWVGCLKSGGDGWGGEIIWWKQIRAATVVTLLQCVKQGHNILGIREVISH